MIVAGDNPTRIRSETAFPKLCGACPVPASSGVTNRHRLFRGGHRQANAALYRVVLVRMRWHQPTIEYVRRRTAEGLSTRDIIRCLKRFVAREIYHALLHDHRVRATCVEAVCCGRVSPAAQGAVCGSRAAARTSSATVPATSVHAAGGMVS